MKNETENIVRVILDNDSTIAPECVQSAIAMLRGEVSTEPETVRPEILTREQVAVMIARSPITVDYYGRNGVIRRVYLRGSSQAQGYSRRSVEEFIERASDPTMQAKAIAELKARAQKRKVRNPENRRVRTSRCK